MRGDNRTHLRGGAMPLAQRAAGITLCAAVAAFAAGATPAAATTGRHHHPTGHHHHHHAGRHHHHHAPAAKRVTVDGLVMARHQRHVTVYATTSRVGHRTAHNTVVHLALRHGAHGLKQMHKGYVVHLVASGHGPMKHLVVPHVHNSHVAPSPATSVVGMVDQVSGNHLVVTPFTRDDGRHSNDGGNGRFAVDTSMASVSVDGGNGKPARGDLVAILGEVTGHSVLAHRVYAFSQEAEVLRGRVVAINGDNVTVKSEDSRMTVSLGSGTDQLPLFVDGSPVATDQLRVGDNLVVLGVVSQEEEGFVPVVAFGFTEHDHGPCGDNPEPRHHH